MNEIDAINKRINELVKDHFVIGGWHIDKLGLNCPTCKTIMKLRKLGLKQIE